MSNAKTAAISDTDGRTLSGKWSLSFPLVLVLITVVLSNAGMWFKAESRSTVLSTELAMVAANVTEMKAVLTKFATETSAELRSLRVENTAIRERLSTEIANLRVELARLAAVPK